MLNKIMAILLVIAIAGSAVTGYFLFDQRKGNSSLVQQVSEARQENTKLAEDLKIVGDSLDSRLVSIEKDRSADATALDEQFTVLTGQVNSLTQDLTENKSSLEAQIQSARSDIESLSSTVGSIIPGVSVDNVYKTIEESIVVISDGTNIVGSGFVYDTVGHIITAAHVIEGVSKIYIVRHDGYFSNAIVMGKALRSDIAVLTMDRFPVKSPATLSSVEANVGDNVIAVGHPYGLTESVTFGIVSQLHRFEGIGTDSPQTWLAGLIQFDAGVNPGSSGGPLLNSEGQVIGMVVAAINPEAGNSIALAVSLGRLRNVIDDIIKKGKASYPYMGVSLQELTPMDSETRSWDNILGILVFGVVPGGPADKGGLRVGDVITSIGDRRVKNAADFFSYLAEYSTPGITVPVQVVRGKDSILIQVNLEGSNEDQLLSMTKGYYHD